MCEQLETLVRDIGYDIEKTLQKTKEERRLIKLLETEVVRIEKDCKKINEEIEKLEEDNEFLEKQIARETENLKSLQCTYDLSVQKEEALNKKLSELKKQLQTSNEENERRLESNQRKIDDFEKQLKSEPLLKLFNDFCAEIPTEESGDDYFERIFQKTVDSYHSLETGTNQVMVENPNNDGEMEEPSADISRNSPKELPTSPTFSNEDKSGNDESDGEMCSPKALSCSSCSSDGGRDVEDLNADTGCNQEALSCSSTSSDGEDKENEDAIADCDLQVSHSLLESPNISMESDYQMELLDTPSVHAMRNAKKMHLE